MIRHVWSRGEKQKIKRLKNNSWKEVWTMLHHKEWSANCNELNKYTLLNFAAPNKQNKDTFSSIQYPLMRKKILLIEQFYLQI